MDSFQLEQLRSDQWRSSTNSCKESLERDDLRQVTLFNTWEDVQKQILNAQDGPTHQEFAILAPSLLQLRTFTEYHFCQLIQKHDTSIFWGLLGLILKLAQDEDGAIPRIPRMLREVFNKTEILNKYCGGSQNSTPETKEACFETGLALLSFFSNIVKFMRSTLIYSAPGNSLDSTWQPLTQQVSSTTRDMDEILSRMETLFRFTGLRTSSRMEESPRRPSTLSMLSNSRDSMDSRDSKKPSQSEETPRFPLVIRPSTRTSRFFQSWSFMLRDTGNIKHEVRPKVKGVKNEIDEKVKVKLEEQDNVGTSTDVEPQIKNESDSGNRKPDDFSTIHDQDIKDKPESERVGGDVSSFRPEPDCRDGLKLPEQNFDDGSISETSGEGESLISASDAEPRDDFKFQPEPGPIDATTEHVKHWLESKPATGFATMQIHEGPKDTFGSTIILYGIPTKVVPGTGGDLDFIPYGFPAGTTVWQAEYGFSQWKGFREISQVLFFRHGGLNSWMYRDLLPDSALSFHGCSSCQKHCHCWWANMRYFRRELEDDIINDRMVLWVSDVVAQNPQGLLVAWSNLGEDNSSRRRGFWRSQLRKEDLLEIFSPLRPGVDLPSILDMGESNYGFVWKQWLYDAAAWLADDIFAYHVSQGRVGKNVARVVFDRFARIRDLPQFQYIPLSLESIPIRANFKSSGQ